MPSSRRRLDLLLVEKGFFSSREQAQRAILAGYIFVEGQRCDQASRCFEPTVSLDCRGQEKYVSRGGHKLEGALEHFGLNPTQWSCLDIGASTGGFTDCLLQQEVAHVTAVDVGQHQLHWKIRNDPRVTVREKINARYLQADDLIKDEESLRDRAAITYDLIVIDVSFISLRLILPPLFSFLSPGGFLLALIKPQFEIGRGLVGKGGIVREEAQRLEVIESLRQWRLQQSDWQEAEDKGVAPSSLSGRNGNQEYFWLLQKRS